MTQENIKYLLLQVYTPPPVVDGKVTKNDYGNIELYKPSMLPEGAVHLPMLNIKKVAQKLNIDCAPAMMGWDVHGGFSHPVFEGRLTIKYLDIMLGTVSKLFQNA